MIGQVSWIGALSSWEILPSAGNKGYYWSSIKLLHSCPYHDGSTTMLLSWKETITIIRLCRCPPNLYPSYCTEKCEDSSDHITFFHLSIDQILRVGHHCRQCLALTCVTNDLGIAALP
ncbi:hypothetical protein TNCV_3089081 [Trichonephila clavipes]|nr:hypothetical protein TNCV_3089081 [Trichonephila clavipes]